MGQPSTKPVAVRIVDLLETRLAAISRTHATISYWNTVRKVERHGAGYPDLNAYPACVIILSDKDITDDLDSDTHSLNTELLNVRIDGWIETATHPDEELQLFETDIRHAVMSDPKWAEADGTCLAVHTFVTRAGYLLAQEINKPRSLVELDITIHYETKVDDLASTRTG